ncbi:2,3-bisphosphoglycerate-independent phosphoglycerate mutase-like [Tachypleus tridentatus]|uniref:2,3-bisphosphoglycerate-independent phosphoglycerate mutase-like n=1 Tax=Tachypleus tridentatus TaxID=6853 RepID=UPI003FD363FA
MSVCLIVIDGWGISDCSKGNAILNASTPVMDKLAAASDQYCTLDASGLSVGLPAGLMGNSEVGHMNIGAGRVMYQDIVRINMDVDNKKISENKHVIEACNCAKANNGRLHFLGLVSDGGVHSHINHLFALLEAAKLSAVPNTYIQFFSDGRDTSPTSGVIYVQQVLDKIKELQYGSLATIMGRYYAMDRDKRHERVKLAFEGMVQGIGEKATPENVIDLIKKRYESTEDKQTDEFLKPIILDESGLIQDNDTMIFIDFRADRMRQITEAFGLERHFETAKVPQNLNIFTMTQYKKEFPFPCLYPPEIPKNVLSEWIASKQLTQFHCAETEKYAHVTFFFNGGQEKAFPLEDRLMVPSPRVATYDLKPEMSCKEVAQEMVKALESGKYPFLMCNFAPPDMVGHTGIYEAAVKAVEATDKAIGMIQQACEKHGYVMLVTADHGNAEVMVDEKGGPVTAHTTNRVPFCMTGFRKFKKLEHNAALCDVATTVLDLMGLDIPPEMTGKSLLAPP